ncbi:MAG: AAA family ATPase, partial [Pseudanabaenaceae cyanobacterium]
MSDNYGKKHTFAAWLNEQFKLRPDLSNRQLAKKLGVQLNLIGKWRRGDVKKPKYENLHKLADIFEEDFDLLVAIAYGSHESIIAESLVEPQFTSTIIEDKQIFGRTNDLEKLIEHSQQSRLLFITGISGIGKSYLAKAFYDSQPQEKFLCKCYHYTSVKDIAEDIGVFSQHDLINDAIKLILQKLNRDRCLLILDNLDLDHQDHGDAYNQLLEQIAETEHQSYVIV